VLRQAATHRAAGRIVLFNRPAGSTDLHARLSDLLTRYDVNENAASVKVYAVKP
jgi:hypothetical protein